MESLAERPGLQEFHYWVVDCSLLAEKDFLVFEELFFCIEDHQIVLAFGQLLKQVHFPRAMLDRFVDLLFDKVDWPVFAPLKVIIFGLGSIQRNLNYLNSF